MLTFFFLLCWWPIFLSLTYENVHIYPHIYLNSVICSSRSSVNTILTSDVVAPYSLQYQWKQSLHGATVGKFAGHSDVPVPAEPLSHCPNHIVEKSRLRTLRVYTMVESTPGNKHSRKIHWFAQSPRWHFNHTYILTDILTYSLSFFWHIFWLGTSLRFSNYALTFSLI